MQGLGLLFLRLVVGGLFLSQGLPKLVPMWGGSPADTANIFQSVGMHPAIRWPSPPASSSRSAGS